MVAEIDKPILFDPDDKRTCGIIMPISDCEPYRSGHWREVQTIIEFAVEKAGLKARLVSENDAAAIIQKTILNNIYFDNIIVCDISGRNPNVMLELGMRLAFNKPVVVIKDELTDYPFDTSALEYVKYNSDLRHQSIVDFQNRLSSKVSGTTRSVGSKKYRSFLDTFGDFEFVDLKKNEVPAGELILRELKDINIRLSQQAGAAAFLPARQSQKGAFQRSISFPLRGYSIQQQNHLYNIAKSTFSDLEVSLHSGAGDEDDHLLFTGVIDEAVKTNIIFCRWLCR